MATNEVPTNDLPQNAIELSTAIRWTARWRDNPEFRGRGFLVPKVDFTEAIGEGAAAIRTYIGINDENETKLLIVGVDNEGNDMIEADLGQYVYDFSHPCPPTCGNPNELNGMNS